MECLSTTRRADYVAPLRRPHSPKCQRHLMAAVSSREVGGWGRGGGDER